MVQLILVDNPARSCLKGDVSILESTRGTWEWEQHRTRPAVSLPCPLFLSILNGGPRRAGDGRGGEHRQPGRRPHGGAHDDRAVEADLPPGVHAPPDGALTPLLAAAFPPPRRGLRGGPCSMPAPAAAPGGCPRRAAPGSGGAPRAPRRRAGGRGLRDVARACRRAAARRALAR